jgi:hypothetical protein
MAAWANPVIRDHSAMAEWIYFILPPCENFAETLTPAEEEASGRHWQLIRPCLEGSIGRDHERD